MALYRNRRRIGMTSPTENRRVRTIYLTDKHMVLGHPDPPHEPGCECLRCGDFRGDLARDWVDMAERAQAMSDVELVVPGLKFRRPLRPGQSVRDRRVDAARTRIRHFEVGDDQLDWVLIGIETTICDRRGRPYPGAAYRAQGRLAM